MRISSFTLSCYVGYLIKTAVAEPIPYPLPAPLPRPIAEPVPAPSPNPDPLPQTTIYTAFSGAVYIVGSNGAVLSSAEPAICPNSAPQGCGNIQVWNWCCPSGTTCAWNSDKSVVGCCPLGSECSGTIPNPQTTVVTVTVQQPATTVPVVVPTTYIPSTTTLGQQPVTETRANTVVVDGYCSTMTMRGLSAPTTAQGACGTVLIVSSEGNRMTGSAFVPVLAFIFGITHFALSRWM